MQFLFPCFVLRHTSGRITVTLIDHPELGVHAESFEDAVLDLTLALDDRIQRTHPRHLWRYAGGGKGEIGKLSVAALRVLHGETWSKIDIEFPTWTRAAPNQMLEAYFPHFDLRYWVTKEDELQNSLRPIVESVLDSIGDNLQLKGALRRRTSIEIISVESTPLRLSSMKPYEIRLDMRPFRSREEQAELDAEEDPKRRKQRAREEERKKRARELRRTPTLKQLSISLHSRSIRTRIEPIWERGEQVARLLDHVERERPSPLVLIAPQGSGKTALLEAMARQMGEPNEPRARKIRPIFLLDASRLIAGASGFGQWQQQLQTCMEEARRSSAILLLGRLVELLDAGKSAHSDSNVAQALAPVLAAREITVIAEATPEDWARVQRRNASFAGVWTPWHLEELHPEATHRVLTQVAASLAVRWSLQIFPDAVEEVLVLCRRFWPDGSLVGNAVTFLRRLVTAYAHSCISKIYRIDVVEFFSVEAGIPVALLRDDISLDPADIREFFSTRVIAQPHAVERVVQVISTIKTSLQDPRKPAAVLLFAGPTGVGKTELAKALAEFVFGSKDRLIRIDMGEYLGPDALSRLLGDGDGPGALPALVRRQPFCVLLLDELEKAHPAVFDALLGVLGEGRLSDSNGHFTDFRNAVIVMTTNLGADTLRSRVGFGRGKGVLEEQALHQHYLGEAQQFFRPEFFNRLDDLIVFHPLGAEAIRTIVVREVQHIAKRNGLLRRDVALQVKESVLHKLAEEGLDPQFGARPLKRTLEQQLVLPIAAWLADHPQVGPVRMEADLGGQKKGLRIRAEPLAHSAEGSREQAEELLEEVAELRILFSQWVQGPAVIRIRSRQTVLAHNLRSKKFWEDPVMAESISQEKSVLDHLVNTIVDLRQSAEAAEDLAVEAWYDRKADHIESIAKEITSMRERFTPLPEKIFLMQGPKISSAMVYLVAPRSAWGELLALLRTYRDWAVGRGLEVTCFFAEPTDDSSRRKKKEDPDEQFHWIRRPYKGSYPWCAAVALDVRGSSAVRFLQIEEGGHRFGSGADSLVKVCVVKNLGKGPPKPSTLKEILPNVNKVPDIRRYSISKGNVQEQRLSEVFQLDLISRPFSLNLNVLHARWIERSCLLGGEFLWS